MAADFVRKDSITYGSYAEEISDLYAKLDARPDLLANKDLQAALARVKMSEKAYCADVSEVISLLTASGEVVLAKEISGIREGIQKKLGTFVPKTQIVKDLERMIADRKYDEGYILSALKSDSLDQSAVSKITHVLAWHFGTTIPKDILDLLLVNIQKFAGDLLPKSTSFCLKELLDLGAKKCPDALVERVYVVAENMNADAVVRTMRGLSKFGIKQCPPPLFARLNAKGVIAVIESLGKTDRALEALASFDNTNELVREISASPDFNLQFYIELHRVMHEKAQR